MPQLKAGGQKKKKSLYTRVGAIRSGFVLLTFHQFIKTKTVVVGEENKRKRRRKTLRRTQQPNDIDSAIDLRNQRSSQVLWPSLLEVVLSSLSNF
jgi:hypothetical protein